MKSRKMRNKCLPAPLSSTFWHLSSKSSFLPLLSAIIHFSSSFHFIIPTLQAQLEIQRKEQTNYLLPTPVTRVSLFPLPCTFLLSYSHPTTRAPKPQNHKIDTTQFSWVVLSEPGSRTPRNRVLYTFTKWEERMRGGYVTDTPVRKGL